MNEHVSKHAATIGIFNKKVLLLTGIYCSRFPSWVLHACYMRFTSYPLFYRVNNICSRLKNFEAPIIKFRSPPLSNFEAPHYQISSAFPFFLSVRSKYFCQHWITKEMPSIRRQTWIIQFPAQSFIYSRSFNVPNAGRVPNVVKQIQKIAEVIVRCWR